MSESATQTSKAEHLDCLIEQWFFETFHGSLIAQSTEVWNAVHAAKEDLKRRLSAFLADPQNP